jgi:hypothetical protein
MPTTRSLGRPHGCARRPCKLKSRETPLATLATSTRPSSYHLQRHAAQSARSTARGRTASRQAGRVGLRASRRLRAAQWDIGPRSPSPGSRRRIASRPLGSLPYRSRVCPLPSSGRPQPASHAAQAACRRSVHGRLGRIAPTSPRRRRPSHHGHGLRPAQRRRAARNRNPDRSLASLRHRRPCCRLRPISANSVAPKITRSAVPSDASAPTRFSP